jgi:predicted porin
LRIGKWLSILHVIALIVIFLLIALSPQIVQARWSFKPRIFVEQQYDDNLFLTETNKQDDYATVIGPGLSFGYESPTALVNLDYQYRRFFYYDFTKLDYDDHRGTLEARKDFTPWFSAGIKERLIRSEDPIDLTGSQNFERPSIRAGQRNRYIRNIVEPEATFRFGEKTSLKLGYLNRILRNNSEDIADQDENAGNALLTYRLNIHNELQLYYQHIDQNYDQTNPPQANRDFKADVTRDRYTYYFSPRTSVFAEYGYVNKDLEQESPGFFDYQVHNPKLGFSRSLYENVNVTLTGGYAVRKTHETNDEDLFTGRLDFAAQYKHLNATVYGERGFFDDYTSAESLGFYKFWRTGLDARYQLLERLTAAAYCYYEKDEYVDQDRTEEYTTLHGRLNYQVLKWTYLSLDYTFNKRHSDIPFDSYQDNRVFFQIRFEYDVAEQYQ